MARTRGKAVKKAPLGGRDSSPASAAGSATSSTGRRGAVAKRKAKSPPLTDGRAKKVVPAAAKSLFDSVERPPPEKPSTMSGGPRNKYPSDSPGRVRLSTAGFNDIRKAGDPIDKAWINEEERQRWLSSHGDFDADRGIRSGDWMGLDQKVGILAHIAFPKHLLGWGAFNKTTQKKLLRLSSKAQLFVERHDKGEFTGEGSSSLFKAWIWRILYDNLFSRDCVDKWSGPEWQAFGDLYRGLDARCTHEDSPYDFSYNNARSYSAKMLYMIHGAHSNVDRLAQIILKEISPIMTLVKLPGPSKADLKPLYESRGHRDTVIGLENYIYKVAEEAVSFDHYIITSARHVLVDVGDPASDKMLNFPYERFAMRVDFCSTDRRSPEGLTVDLVTRPLLRAYGIPAGSQMFSVKDGASIAYVIPMIRNHTTKWWYYPMRTVVGFMDEYIEPPAAEDIGRNWAFDYERYCKD